MRGIHPSVAIQKRAPVPLPPAKMPAPAAGPAWIKKNAASILIRGQAFRRRQYPSVRGAGVGHNAAAPILLLKQLSFTTTGFEPRDPQTNSFHSRAGCNLPRLHIRPCDKQPCFCQQYAAVFTVWGAGARSISPPCLQPRLQHVHGATSASSPV